MYGYLNSTLRDFNPELFIVHTGKNDIPVNNSKQDKQRCR